MAVTPPSSPRRAVVIDASFLIAICAKEAGSEQLALAEFHRYARLGAEFFAPGILIAEALYVLCGKVAGGTLDAAGHVQAVTELEVLANGISPPPGGEAALVLPAEAIRSGYGCRRSADGLYIALAQQLALTRPTVLLTFDKELPKQAHANAPAVTVQLL